VLLRFAFDNILTAARCHIINELPNMPFERATKLSLASFMTSPFVWKAKWRLHIDGEQELMEATCAMRQFTQQILHKRRIELRSKLCHGGH
jgi:hypothetical protein